MFSPESIIKAIEDQDKGRIDYRYFDGPGGKYGAKIICGKVYNGDSLTKNLQSCFNILCPYNFPISRALGP